MLLRLASSTITEPEIGVLHLDVQFALVVVETPKFGVEVLDELVDTMQQTITSVRQSAQSNNSPF